MKLQEKYLDEGMIYETESGAQYLVRRFHGRYHHFFVGHRKPDKIKRKQYFDPDNSEAEVTLIGYVEIS